MRGGKIVQYDTPDEILLRPVNAFVEDFVGADRALRRLSLYEVSKLMEPLGEDAGAHRIAVDADLRNALSAMISVNTDRLTVVDATGTPLGIVTRDAITAL